jgi:predicted secreted protein
MAKFNGTALKAETVGTPNRPIANVRSISFTMNTATIDVTDIDSGGWTELLGGVRGHNGKLNGLVDFNPATGKDNVAELIQYSMARTLVEVIFTTKVSGDVAFSGKYMYSNVTFGTNHEGEATWSADVQGSGALVVADIV